MIYIKSYHLLQLSQHTTQCVFHMKPCTVICGIGHGQDGGKQRAGQRTCEIGPGGCMTGEQSAGEQFTRGQGGASMQWWSTTVSRQENVARWGTAAAQSGPEPGWRSIVISKTQRGPNRGTERNAATNKQCSRPAAIRRHSQPSTATK
jgi:hypothetical protein